MKNRVEGLVLILIIAILAGLFFMEHVYYRQYNRLSHQTTSVSHP